MLSSSLKERETVKEKDIKKEELAETEESKDKQNREETAVPKPEIPPLRRKCLVLNHSADLKED